MPRGLSGTVFPATAGSPEGRRQGTGFTSGRRENFLFTAGNKICYNHNIRLFGSRSFTFRGCVLTMISVALDGPAGAGKSTIAKEAARRLGFLHVDTGALYRAIGLDALRRGADPADPAQVLPHLEETHITLQFTGEGQRICLRGEDVSEAIREPRASMAASSVSAMPEVRQFLLELQRELARKNDVIMDGRDIGTVVLPQADVKIFLTASPQERAKRRHAELAAKGNTDSYETVLRDILERDERDSSRSAAPLQQAEDALLFDTTDYSLEECVDRLLQIVREKTI